MSDGYAIRRYHRRMIALPETIRKKYSVLIFILFITGITGMFLVIAGSGLLAEGNPGLSQQLVGRINLERQANNIVAVQEDDALTASALASSRKIRASPSTSLPAATADPAGGTNVVVIQKIPWALSGYSARDQLFDALENSDPRFRNNILSEEYRNIGVGISSDALNYFIVIQWR